MAVCDANYCFTFVDIEGFGRDNDAAIFEQFEMGAAFDNEEFDIPDPRNINDHTLPYVLVADEMFQLKPWLMKPFSGRTVDV